MSFVRSARDAYLEQGMDTRSRSLFASLTRGRLAVAYAFAGIAAGAVSYGFGQSQNFDVFSLFEGGVYSHEARCMKPHEPIYREVIQQFALEPAQTFYIDDLAANIVTGQRLGLQCHPYDPNQHERLVHELAAWMK